MNQVTSARLERFTDVEHQLSFGRLIVLSRDDARDNGGQDKLVHVHHVHVDEAGVRRRVGQSALDVDGQVEPLRNHVLAHWRVEKLHGQWKVIHFRCGRPEMLVVEVHEEELSTVLFDRVHYLAPFAHHDLAHQRPGRVELGEADCARHVHVAAVPEPYGRGVNGVGQAVEFRHDHRPESSRIHHVVGSIDDIDGQIDSLRVRVRGSEPVNAQLDPVWREQRWPVVDILHGAREIMTVEYLEKQGRKKRQWQ